VKLAPSGRTLIVQPLPGIGDMVWHLPHIHAIAATTIEGRVDILTKPRSQADQLLGADPCVDRVLWLEREAGRHAGVRGLLRLAALLRRENYQRAWFLHGSARYALAARLAGVPERIGYGIGLQSLLLTVPVRLPTGLRHAHPILRADALLNLLEIPRTEPEPRLTVDATAGQAVAKRFAAWPDAVDCAGHRQQRTLETVGRGAVRGIGAGVAPPTSRFDFHCGRTGGTGAGG
jgi:heptosyltransferase-2